MVTGLGVALGNIAFKKLKVENVEYSLSGKVKIGYVCK